MPTSSSLSRRCRPHATFAPRNNQSPIPLAFLFAPLTVHCRFTFEKPTAADRHFPRTRSRLRLVIFYTTRRVTARFNSLRVSETFQFVPAAASF